MASIEFKNRTHWARILLRVLLVLLMVFLSIIVIGLLRRTVHLSTILICLCAYTGVFVYLSRLEYKKKLCVHGDYLRIEEHYIFKKNVTLDIPISKIDDCILIGYGPYQSIQLLVHGHLYTLRNMQHAAEIVDIINDKIKE